MKHSDQGISTKLTPVLLLAGTTVSTAGVVFTLQKLWNLRLQGGVHTQQSDLVCRRVAVAVIVFRWWLSGVSFGTTKKRGPNLGLSPSSSGY